MLAARRWARSPRQRSPPATATPTSDGVVGPDDPVRGRRLEWARRRGAEWGTFFDDLKNGTFKICTLQWAELEEPDIMHWIFHSKRIPGGTHSGANRGAYRNARVDEPRTSSATC